MTSYTFFLVFKLVESLQFILKEIKSNRLQINEEEEETINSLTERYVKVMI